MSANPITVSVFVTLFAAISSLGFLATRWKKADLSQLSEWGVGGTSLWTAADLVSPGR